MYFLRGRITRYAPIVSAFKDHPLHIIKLSIVLMLDCTR